jgi:hypothetical protein
MIAHKGRFSEFVETGAGGAAPAGYIPYSSHHAIKRKLQARIAALEAENAALRSREGAATEKLAPRPVLCGGLSRPVIVLGHAETERNGLTHSSAGETGGIGPGQPDR